MKILSERDGNVDFYIIKFGGKYIGLQIKPVIYEQASYIYQSREWMSKAHEKFEKEYGGKVFCS